MAVRDAMWTGVYAWLGCVLAGAVLAAVDVAFSTSPAIAASTGASILARVALMTVVGATFGLAAAPAVVAAGAVVRRVRRGEVIVTALVAVGAAGIVHEAVWVTLRGLAERQPALARSVGMTAIGGAALGAAVLCLVVIRLTHKAPFRNVAVGLLLAVTLALALVLARADLTVLVALYAQAHLLLEGASWVLCATAVGLGCWWIARVRLGRRLLLGVAMVAAVWCGLWATDTNDRFGLDPTLLKSRRDNGYGTRMRLRAENFRDFLHAPTTWRGSHLARMSRLKRRYDIVTTDLQPKWDLPRTRARAADLSEETSRLPEGLNLVVVFVDTLRADVADDPRVMPNLAKLRARSFSFERAYSTASDTVSALPVLTGGCYGKTPCDGDVLALARAMRLRSGIVMAKSARRFLASHSPDFAFEQVVEISDYVEGKKVWGYGADESTATRVSQASLDWIDEHPKERFMLWSFHFDVHNWLQLDQRRLEALAHSHGIGRDEKRWRYPAAVAGVDEALGELIDGLAKRGLDQRTAILVVSDHGEGLGHKGHWQHAVYLWDTLIRVPLVLHIPGMRPSRIDRPVGHVDVAPTVALLLDPQLSLDQYHGVPLHHDSRQHDLPLLMFSMRKNDLLRVGVVARDRAASRLELPIDSMEPELFDEKGTERGPGEDAHGTLRLLAELVTSPVFPRVVAEDGGHTPPTEGGAP